MELITLILFPYFIFSGIDTFSFDAFKAGKPLEMKVLYSRKENLYLVFYDRDRKELWIRYKTHKFDSRLSHLENRFIPGMPYLLKLQPEGFLWENRFYDLQEISGKPENFLIPVFSLLEDRSAVIDEISF